MAVPGAVTAGTGRRLLAGLVDTLVASVGGGALLVAGSVTLLTPAGGQGAPGRTVPGAAELMPVVLGGLLVLAVALVQWWCVATRGWSLGKRLVGLRVLSPSTGRPVGLRRAAIRRLVRAVAWLVPVLGPVLLHLSPFLDATGRRHAWHDRAAGTVVYDVVRGRDPMTSTPVDASAAVRRLDSLLTAPSSPMVAFSSPLEVPAAAVAAAAGQHTAPSPGAVPAPATVAPPHRPLAVVVPPPVPPPVPEGPASAGAGPADRPAPATRAAGASRAPDGSGAPGATGAGSSGLPDEVDRTRLRPARAKVPAIPAGAGRAPVVLRLTDGQRVVLTRTALVGRAPVPGPEDGDVQLVVVADPGRSVSKTHLAVGLDRSGVWVRDRGSTNGTVVTLPDGRQVLCATGQPVRLPAGASAAFGDYGFTVADADG